MSELIELKPCPFCGETPDASNPDVFWIDSNQGNKWGSVKCCIYGPEVRTGYAKDGWQQDAADAWNERVVVGAPAVPALSDDQIISLSLGYGELEDGLIIMSVADELLRFARALLAKAK